MAGKVPGNVPNVASGKWVDFDYVVEPPRKSPSGKTALEELLDRALRQKKDTRSTPVRRIDPRTGEWVTTSADEIPNERARGIVEALFGTDERVRTAVIEEFKNLPGDQKQAVAIAIANEFPNPAAPRFTENKGSLVRATEGFSPFAREVMDVLQGKPVTPERAAAASEAARLGDFSEGWSSNKKGVGRDAAETLEYDDSSVLDTVPESDFGPMDQRAVGDLAAVTDGARRPKPPADVDSKKVRVGDFETKRPYLREPKSTIEMAVRDGRRVPLRIVGDPDSGTIGPQDNPAFRQGEKYESAFDAREQDIRDALAARYGSQEAYANELADAVRSGDKRRVKELVDEAKALIGQLESRPIPEKPYPVGGSVQDKGRQAERSLQAEQQPFTESALRMADGDTGAIERVWDFLNKNKGKKRGGKKSSAAGAAVISPSDKGSGIPTPESFVDLAISDMAPEVLPRGEALARWRADAIAAVRDRYWGGTARPADMDASPVGNPSPMRPSRVEGKDPARSQVLESWEREARRRGPNADAGKPDRDLSGAVEDFGQPMVEGVQPQKVNVYDPDTDTYVPQTIDPVEAQQKALRNSIHHALNSGRMVYRDPDTGKVLSAVISNRTTPERLRFMRENFPSDLVPEETVAHLLPKVIAEKPPREFAPAPPGFTRGPDGHLVPDSLGLTDGEEIQDITESLGLTPQQVHGQWQYNTGGRGPEWRDDIPYIPEEADKLDEAARTKIEAENDAPAIDEGLRREDVGYDVPEIDDPTLKETVATLRNLDATRDEFDLAVERYRQAIVLRDSIQEPELKIEFDEQVIKPLDEAIAFRRNARANPQSAPQVPNVADNLDAADSPIDAADDAASVDGDISPTVSSSEDPSLNSADNTRPQEPARPVEEEANANADAAEMAADEEAEVAEEVASTGNAPPRPPNNATQQPQPAPQPTPQPAAANPWPPMGGGRGAGQGPQPTPQAGPNPGQWPNMRGGQANNTPPAPQNTPPTPKGRIQRIKDHLYNNRVLYGLASLLGPTAMIAYNAASNSAPYAPGEEPLRIGDEVMPVEEAPLTAEERIRRVRTMMRHDPMQQTLARPY